MRVLIIGSNGFLGSHCFEYFSRHHQTVGCDIQPGDGASNYFEIDAAQTDYTTLFKDNDFDLCINCSGAASVSESVVNPTQDYKLNVQNVELQLEAIARYSPGCKYLNLSSAAVYGNPVYLPIDEAHPLNPISPYGKHKRMAEELCYSFYKNRGLSTCSVRIFSAYGEGLRKQLFWDLGQKTKSPPVILYGTGNESRDFIHASDVVTAIDAVVANSNFEADIVNVARGQEISIRTAAATFYKLYDNTIGFSFGGEERIGDPVNWVANIDRLLALGFSPKTDLNSGLSSYVAWLEENA